MSDFLGHLLVKALAPSKALVRPNLPARFEPWPPSILERNRPDPTDSDHTTNPAIPAAIDEDSDSTNVTTLVPRRRGSRPSPGRPWQPVARGTGELEHGPQEPETNPPRPGPAPAIKVGRPSNLPAGATPARPAKLEASDTHTAELRQRPSLPEPPAALPSLPPSISTPVAAHSLIPREPFGSEPAVDQAGRDGGGEPSGPIDPPRARPSPAVAPSSEARPTTHRAKGEDIETGVLLPPRGIQVSPIRPETPGPGPTPALPTIQVTIGRLEVRALVASNPSARPAAPVKTAVMSLDDYLRQRAAGASR